MLETSQLIARQRWVQGFLILLILLVSYASQVCAAYQPHGFIDTSVYGDYRNFATITIVEDLKLPHNFEYFSFTNFDFNSLVNDSYAYYTEQNLFYRFDSGIDLANQLVLTTGSNNNAYRLGTRLRISEMKVFKKFFEYFNLQYYFSIYPYQIDRNNIYNMAMEHYYRIQVLPQIFKDRIYLSGFVDHNLELGYDSQVPSVSVNEHQLGVRVYKQLYTIAELRYNGLLNKDQVGLGLGLQYFLSF